VHRYRLSPPHLEAGSERAKVHLGRRAVDEVLQAQKLDETIPRPDKEGTQKLLSNTPTAAEGKKEVKKGTLHEQRRPPLPGTFLASWPPTHGYPAR
jgi:hypothetical protein